MTASCPSVRDVSAIGRALASYASTVDSPHGHQNTPGGTPGGAARSGSLPDARGHLHPPRPPFRPRRGADRAARLPLREGARAPRLRGGGDPRRSGDRRHRRRRRGVAVPDRGGRPDRGRQARDVHRTCLPEPARPARHRALLDERRRDLRSPAARRAARLVRREPDVRGAARPLRRSDQAAGRPARHPPAATEPLSLQRVDRQHRGLDGLHPGLGRHPAVHLGHAPLLRPPARLLPRRPAARQRPAAAVREVRDCSTTRTPSTCGTSSGGRWST